MRAWWLVLALCCAPMAWGQEPTPVGPDGLPLTPNPAEYRRLSDELVKLGNRNAWVGVERTFEKLQNTLVDPSFRDWVQAAHSARARGDIGLARDRLMAALKVREGRDVIEWLAQIDMAYGRAVFTCDPGKDYELSIEQMPFSPEERRAVEFAVNEIYETCEFRGYIPKGVYHFGTKEDPIVTKLIPRVQMVQIELRTLEGDDLEKAMDKQAKKRERADRKAVKRGEPEAPE